MPPWLGLVCLRGQPVQPPAFPPRGKDPTPPPLHPLQLPCLPSPYPPYRLLLVLSSVILCFRQSQPLCSQLCLHTEEQVRTGDQVCFGAVWGRDISVSGESHSSTCREHVLTSEIILKCRGGKNKERVRDKHTRRLLSAMGCFRKRSITMYRSLLLSFLKRISKTKKKKGKLFGESEWPLSSFW